MNHNSPADSRLHSRRNSPPEPIQGPFAQPRVAQLLWLALGLVICWPIAPSASAQEQQAGAPPKPQPWKYSASLLRPFWQGETVEGESVLFIKDPATGEARASVLFPIREIVAIRNSAGDVTYEQGKDYLWKPDSREITLPVGSRIPAPTAAELRRPEKTQPYRLTHRDGNGEILFGAKLEYAAMQACVTYRHAPDLWKSPVPTFAGDALPRTMARLQAREPLSVVVLGDSISTGANASKMFNAAPFQPAYPELVQQHLHERFGSEVTLTNLSVGGTSTPWALGMVDKVSEHKPQLMIVAFGMNDASGRPAAEYQTNIDKLIKSVRERSPECEFILVAPMLGNRNWVALKPELFPAYRDKLKELTGPGIALADLTSIWEVFLERKQDWDQTGNGVNHPNDFGHRVYAQVIAALLEPAASLPKPAP
jgi:acyl-CoA thioesterase-1